MIAMPFHRPAARPSRRSRTLVVASAAVALAGVVLVAPGATASAAPVTPAGRFVPLSPTRVLDTDTAGGSFRQDEVRTVDLSKAFTAPASAVVLNLTAAGGTADSFQTVFPAGTARPNASSLNELRGSVRANSVTVAVGQGGANQNDIEVYNSAGSVRIVVDVTGYYTSGTDASQPGTAYVPLASPNRLFDTRVSPGPMSTTAPYDTGTVTVDYGSPELNQVIRAVAVNITVTEPAGPGYLTLWDGVSSRPGTSSINFAAGQTVANLATVPVRCVDSSCKQLTFSIYNGVSSSTQVIADIQGAYVTPGQAGSTLFVPSAPVRLVDTRNGAPWPALGTDSSGTVAPTAWDSRAQAVNLNVTAVLPQQPAFLTVWASGAPRPGTSSLNARPGDVVPNAVQTRVGPGGFQIYNNVGRTDVVVDYAGSFVPDPAAASS